MALIPKSTIFFTKNRDPNVIKKLIPFSTNVWNGDNLTSNALGFDDLYSGVAFGQQGVELGGIKHFETSKTNP